VFGYVKFIYPRGIIEIRKGQISMQITYKGDYALKALLYLALHYNKDIVSMQELAKKLDIPIKFLEQIFLELKKGKFVESKRGIKGGYFLARAPKDIRIGDVVRFIDGPIEPIACASISKEYKGCADIYSCAFREVWVKVSKAISEIVDGVTLEDLSSKVSNSKSISYSI